MIEMASGRPVIIVQMTRAKVDGFWLVAVKKWIKQGSKKIPAF
jgi:hypothetical protein